MKQLVWAAVVTHNRIEMLKRCVASLRAQTRLPEQILVVDNGSTDGTLAWLETQSDLKVVRQANLGSAGGQNTAFSAAVRSGADYVWTMDDDVIPEPAALAELMDATRHDPEFGFLCSAVWDGKRQSLLNVPNVDLRPGGSGYPEWARNLDSGVVAVCAATFVSILVPSAVVREVGLPLKEMFIWADDTEYTLRITRKRKAYLVGRSRVLHLRVTAGALSVFSEKDPNRRKNYWRLYRNRAYVARRYSRGVLSIIAAWARIILDVRSFTPSIRGCLSVSVMIYGVICGMFFSPRVEDV